MTLFTYKAADADGRIVTGSQDAADEQGVVAHLRALGYVPIRVASAGGAPSPLSLGGKRLALPSLKRVSDKDVLRFTEDLATLLGSGLTLDRSLRILRDAADNPALQAVLGDVLKAVQKGTDLSDALAEHPGAFSQFYVNMVKAGEAGGFLHAILDRMSTYLRDVRELKDYVVSAMVYPLFLLAIGGASILILLTYVLPKFAVIFADMGQAVPLPTQLLLGAASFLREYFALLLAAAAAGIFLARRFLATEWGRYRVDALLRRLPVAGSFVQELETARFARTLGTLIRSGVPILGSLTLVQGVTRNRVIAESLDAIRERVREGDTLARPMADSHMFPPLATQMVTVGEETGRLDEMLIRIGDIYEKKVRSFIKKAMSLLEPVVILAMGIVIGFVVISMLMAIFSMNDLPF